VRQFPVTSAGSAVTTRPTTISTGLLQVCRPDILSRMMNNPGAYTGVKLLVLVAALMFLTPAGLVGQSQVKPADILRAQPAWLKQSSRGATLEATQGVRDGSTVQYHLIAKGLSSDVVYQVLAWPVTDPAPQVSIEGVSIGKDGIVMCAGREPNQCGMHRRKTIRSTSPSTLREENRSAWQRSLQLQESPSSSFHSRLQVKTRAALSPSSG